MLIYYLVRENTMLIRLYLFITVFSLARLPEETSIASLGHANYKAILFILCMSKQQRH